MELSKYNYGGWRDGSAVKSTYCTCKGSQDPGQAAHDFHGDPIPLASSGICTRVHVLTCERTCARTHSLTHTHTNIVKVDL